MGYPRPRPQHLAEKLLSIRLHSKLSQAELARRLGVKNYNDVWKWERNINEPSLIALLAYSSLSGYSINDLADDGVNLYS